MGPHKKSVLIVTILCIISVYLTFYTVKAHTISARHIYDDAEGNTILWRTSPGGSLFPWPKEPGPLEALSKMDEVDLFVYRYLIKPWVLVGLSILLWIVTGLSVSKRFKVMKTRAVASLITVWLVATLFAMTWSAKFDWPDYEHTNYGFPMVWATHVLSTIAGSADKWQINIAALFINILFWLGPMVICVAIILHFRRRILK